MKITLTSDDSIRLEPLQGPMTIEADSVEMQYSPFHMLASGLAFCTFSVLHSWASNAGVHWEDLSISVGWKFEEKPHRVGSMDVKLIWPSLPDDRTSVALRASQLCAIHATLSHPPRISISREGPAATSTIDRSASGP